MPTESNPSTLDKRRAELDRILPIELSATRYQELLMKFGGTKPEAQESK